jgi:phosphonoacetaldehyde hydrolase
MSSPIAAVIFDWAGTMIDFGCLAPIEALVTAFRGQAVEITPEEARRDMGMAKRDHVAALLNDPVIAARWQAARGAAPSWSDGDRLYDALVPLMREAASRHARLIPGAVELIAHLHAQGIKFGSTTGYTREMMQDILPVAAAQGYRPEVVVCAGETPVGRPSPLMMWKALAELRAWPAHACVKVDDAEVGVAEGRAAGAWSVGVAASGNGMGLGFDAYLALPEAERRARSLAAGERLRANGADFVIDSIADLPPLLAEIEQRIRSGLLPGRPLG